MLKRQETGMAREEVKNVSNSLQQGLVLSYHCVLEKRNLDQNSLDRGQYYLVECKMFPN